MPAKAAEHVGHATGAGAKLDRQPVGRTDSGHVAATALGRENRPDVRERDVRQRVAGIGTGPAAVARTQETFGRFAGHA